MVIGIEHELEQIYSLKIEKVSPLRDGYVLETSSGNYFLRIPKISTDRIDFVYSAQKHLINNGFDKIDAYRLTSDTGLPWTIINETNYVLTPHIVGKDCIFENSKDLATASRLLASMHLAAKGFVPLSQTAYKTELGQMPLMFQHRLDELKRFRRIARKSSGRFDYAFLKVADYYCDLAENIIKQLNASPYGKLVSKANTEGCLCHRDFTGHTIVLTQNGDYIINFENCCVELELYDIANFLRRRMRKCDWDSIEAKYMFDHYNSIRQISNEEYYVLSLILQFPQKLWRVVNKYYNSKRSWCEKNCMEKLQEVLDEKEPLQLFIDSFDALY